MLKSTKLWIGTVVFFFFVSCNININNGINGKGEMISKDILLKKDFNKISISKGWKVELIPSKENKIYINANENLVGLFEYEIKNQQLQITSKKKINILNNSLIKIYHTTSLIRYSTSSGSHLLAKEKSTVENIHINTSSGSTLELNLKSKNTKANTSSGSTLMLEGTSINFVSNTSSGSEIEAKNFSVKNAEIKTSSGGDVEINVIESIHAEASSGGSIDYYGNPKNKKIKESISSGEIKQH